MHGMNFTIMVSTPKRGSIMKKAIDPPTIAVTIVFRYCNIDRFWIRNEVSLTQ